MTEALAHMDSSDSTQLELSNEYQHDRVWMVFKNLFVACALDESNLSIERAKSVFGLLLSLH